MPSCRAASTARPCRPATAFHFRPSLARVRATRRSRYIARECAGAFHRACNYCPLSRTRRKRGGGRRRTARASAQGAQRARLSAPVADIADAGLGEVQPGRADGPRACEAVDDAVCPGNHAAFPIRAGPGFQRITAAAQDLARPNRTEDPGAERATRMSRLRSDHGIATPRGVLVARLPADGRRVSQCRCWGSGLAGRREPPT